SCWRGSSASCRSSAAPSSSSSRSKASATPRSARSPASARPTRSGSLSRPRDSSRRSGNMNTDDNELDEISAAARTVPATWASDRVEKLAEPKLEQAQSPLMVSYKEKLMLLDDAIADCRTAIRTNRQNANLRRQLLSIYTEKQRTLQDVLREESHESR